MIINFIPTVASLLCYFRGLNRYNESSVIVTNFDLVDVVTTNTSRPYCAIVADLSNKSVSDPKKMQLERVNGLESKD